MSNNTAKLSLEDVFSNSKDIKDINNIPKNIRESIEKVGMYCFEQKGVYTVLTALSYYKYLHPEQDIRYHQKKLPDGFSCRTFDYKYITPVLNKLGLPAMAESGYLTRSLEQSHPYDKDYTGAIRIVKKEFLESVDYLQKNPNCALNILRILLHKVDEINKTHVITITPLDNPENLTIEKIVGALTEHFLSKYGTHNGAKLPVLAFHSIYECLISELKRYDECELAPLSSLTACDKTNKASGDIEIFRNKHVFEAIEIKLDKKIDSQILRVVESKIYKWNPQRYYILSVLGLEESDKEEINEIVLKVLNEHGCQIIINGLIPTIKYYLRLITNLDDFIKKYSKAVEIDKELQLVHKSKWVELLEKYEL